MLSRTIEYVLLVCVVALGLSLAAEAVGQATGAKFKLISDAFGLEVVTGPAPIAQSFRITCGEDPFGREACTFEPLAPPPTFEQVHIRRPGGCGTVCDRIRRY